jgi:hypothetical protein
LEILVEGEGVEGGEWRGMAANFVKLDLFFGVTNCGAREASMNISETRFSVIISRESCIKAGSKLIIIINMNNVNRRTEVRIVQLYRSLARLHKDGIDQFGARI